MQERGYIPAEITGGESIWVSSANTAQSSSDIIFSNYSPENGYTLAYTFSASLPITVEAIANDDNTGWTLDVTGAQTLTLAAGRVAYIGMVTHTATARTFVVDSGGLYVNASPMRISSWVAVLAAIDSAILAIATNPQGSISVDGMSISYKSGSDLTNLRDYAKRQADKDTGRKSPRRILTRFL